MPLTALTQLNAYELGNKTDIDDLTTDIDNKIRAALIPNNLTSAAGATAVAVEAAASSVYMFTIPTAGAGNYDLLMPTGRSFQVTGMFCIATGTHGGNANTFTASNAGNAITDAVNLTGKVAGDRVTASTVNIVHSSIASGGTLRVVKVHVGGTSGAMVFVEGMLRT